MEDVHWEKREEPADGSGCHAPALAAILAELQHKMRRIMVEAPQTTVSAGVTPRMPRQPSKWTVLAIVGIGVFMCTMDSSIVNVSLPAIARHFGVPVGAAVE